MEKERIKDGGGYLKGNWVLSSEPSFMGNETGLEKPCDFLKLHMLRDTQANEGPSAGLAVKQPALSTGPFAMA